MLKIFKLALYWSEIWIHLTTQYKSPVSVFAYILFREVIFYKTNRADLLKTEVPLKNATLEKEMLSFGQVGVFISIILVGDVLILFLKDCCYHWASELCMKINEAFVALNDYFTFYLSPLFEQQISKYKVIHFAGNLSKWSCIFQTLNISAFCLQEFNFIPLELTPTRFRSGCCCAQNHLESFCSKFYVHHHNYCLYRALEFLWLTPRHHYSWPTQDTERVCMNSLWEVRKLRPSNVKWLAQGHKAGNVRAAGFLPGPVFPDTLFACSCPLEDWCQWQMAVLWLGWLPLDEVPLFAVLLWSFAFVACLWRMFDQSPNIMLDANYLSPWVAFDQFDANTPPS